jgi:DNA-directed RNA polymerase specialized sigma24 family protein
MASTGDRLKELEVLYRFRFGQFVRTAAAITGGVESGADAVHDAFVSCVRGLDGFRGEGPLEALSRTGSLPNGTGSKAAGGRD